MLKVGVEQGIHRGNFPLIPVSAMTKLLMHCKNLFVQPKIDASRPIRIGLSVSENEFFPFKVTFVS